MGGGSHSGANKTNKDSESIDGTCESSDSEVKPLAETSFTRPSSRTAQALQAQARSLASEGLV